MRPSRTRGGTLLVSAGVIVLLAAHALVAYSFASRMSVSMAVIGAVIVLLVVMHRKMFRP